MAETIAGGVAKGMALFHNPAIPEIQRREMVSGGRQQRWVEQGNQDRILTHVGTLWPKPNG